MIDHATATEPGPITAVPCISTLIAALVAAKKAFTPALKDKTNAFFNGSKYTSLAAVIAATDDALTANGLAVIQTPDLHPEKGTVLRSILFHTCGASLTFDYPLNPVKSDPQGMGSAVTYARRYSLMALLGIAPEDDDGNQASGNHPQDDRRDYQRQERPDTAKKATSSAPASSKLGTAAAANASTTTTAATATPSTTATAEDDTKVKEAFGALKKRDEALAAGIWFGWPTNAERLPRLLKALLIIEDGIAKFGEDSFWDSLDFTMAEAGWPSSKTAKRNPKGAIIKDGMPAAAVIDAFLTTLEAPNKTSGAA